MAAEAPGSPMAPSAAPEFALPTSLSSMKDKLQVDLYAKALQKKQGGKGLFSRRSKSSDAPEFTVEDLLFFSKDVRTGSELSSWA